MAGRVGGSITSSAQQTPRARDLCVFRPQEPDLCWARYFYRFHKLIGKANWRKYIERPLFGLRLPSVGSFKTWLERLCGTSCRGESPKACLLYFEAALQVDPAAFPHLHAGETRAFVELATAKGGLQLHFERRSRLLQLPRLAMRSWRQ